jgi:hypothetical protein
VKLTRTWI